MPAESNCVHPELEELESLLEGSSATAATQVQEHVDACRSCQTRLEDLRENAALLPELRELAGRVEPAAGSVLAGYRLDKQLSRGGQGTVFAATQVSTGRRVALKLLHGGTESGARQRERFEREVEVLTRLRHPFLVTIQDRQTTEDGWSFLVMDYIDGTPLDRFLEERSLDVTEKLLLFGRIATGLASAHSSGVIHCDLKPENILVDAAGHPHILDFGLAKHRATGAARRLSEITVAGEFTGTLAYASPEQVEGKPERVDARTDLYAMGVLLHQMLTGELPHRMEGSLATVLREILEKEAPLPSLSAEEVSVYAGSREVDAICSKLLEKDPGARYQSADALCEDLRRLLQGQPVEAAVGRRGYFRSLPVYRFRKFLARNRAAALLFVLFVGSAILGTASTLHYYRIAREAQAAAVPATPPTSEPRPILPLQVPTLRRTGETLSEPAMGELRGEDAAPGIRIRIRGSRKSSEG